MIIINGQSFVSNGTKRKINVTLDGELIFSNLDTPLEIVVQGDLIELNSDMNVKVNGNVNGPVTCEMNFTATGDVNGNVEADMNVKCGNVKGHVESDMNITCGDIGGSAKAGMNIKRK